VEPASRRNHHSRFDRILSLLTGKISSLMTQCKLTIPQFFILSFY
jgi:hypothetical protein